MAAAPNTLTPEEQAEGFKLIFDGQSLEGFRNFRKEGIDPKWIVEDGAIVLTERGGGDIITTAEYGDFEFRFEFRIAAHGNSGVMWRVSEIGKMTYETGPEFQILDSKSTEGYKHETSKGNVCGALYDLVPAEVEIFRGAEEWNEGVIRVVGTKIRLELNGTVTADVDTTSDEWREMLAKSKFATWENYNRMAKGHLAFQDHNDRVAFRSLRIREL